MPLPNKALRTVVILSVFGLLSSSAQSKPGLSNIELGDRYFEQMKYLEAVTAYQPDSANPEADWRIARAYICYADVITKDREYYYHKAENAAKKCIKLDPKLSYGHSWLAAALGNLAIYEGSRTKVLLCNQIKSELDKALAINPKDDIALSIYGSFYRVLGDISWFERNLATLFLGGIPPGGYEDSERYLNRAIQVSPNTMRHWFELGMLYRSWGKEDKEKEAFLRARKCPVVLLSDKDRLQLISKYLNE